MTEYIKKCLILVGFNKVILMILFLSIFYSCEQVSISIEIEWGDSGKVSKVSHVGGYYYFNSMCSEGNKMTTFCVPFGSHGINLDIPECVRDEIENYGMTRLIIEIFGIGNNLCPQVFHGYANEAIGEGESKIRITLETTDQASMCAILEGECKNILSCIPGC